MGIAIAVIIILVAVVLAGVGAYIVIFQDKSDTESPAEQVSHSGIYSVVRGSPRTAAERIKPKIADVLQWLASQPNISAAKKERLLADWQASFDASIRTVEDCDKNGISTFHVQISESDKPHCSFLGTDNYLTREQIYNHPELLPPYYLGCGCILVPKPADATASWRAVVPVEGRYLVPDWRQLV